MRIVIVDSQCVVRQGLKMILSLEKSFQITGEAGNVGDGINIILNEKPDIVVMDLNFGNESGLEIMKQVKAKNLNCKFIILTTSADYRDFRSAEQAGVDGYILKDALPEEIIYAIKIIKAGRKFYDANLMTSAMNLKKNNPFINESIKNLTQREVEVLMALGKGFNNGEIAKVLFITEYTVKKHVSQILYKLGVTDRTQAALYASTHGLVG